MAEVPVAAPAVVMVTTDGFAIVAVAVNEGTFVTTRGAVVAKYIATGPVSVIVPPTGIDVQGVKTNTIIAAVESAWVELTMTEVNVAFPEIAAAEIPFGPDLVFPVASRKKPVEVEAALAA